MNLTRLTQLHPPAYPSASLSGIPCHLRFLPLPVSSGSHVVISSPLGVHLISASAGRPDTTRSGLILYSTSELAKPFDLLSFMLLDGFHE